MAIDVCFSRIVGTVDCHDDPGVVLDQIVLSLLTVTRLLNL